MKDYSKMTDDELEKAIRAIVNRSTSEEQVNQIAKDELGYPGGIAVCFSDPEPRMQMQMKMFMAHGKDRTLR